MMGPSTWCWTPRELRIAPSGAMCVVRTKFGLDPQGLVRDRRWWLDVGFCMAVAMIASLIRGTTLSDVTATVSALARTLH